jgi:hypothetical protein
MPTIMPDFRSSWLKIERANKYIAEIELLVRDFGNSGFYDVRIEYEDRACFLCIDIDKSRFPFDQSALAIGDALHNLRTALDHLWYQTILGYSGISEDWSLFPIRDVEEKIVTAMDNALKKKRISRRIADLMLDTIKPYQGGNRFLWSLHVLNNGDKHKMLVPVLELMQIYEFRLEDKKTREHVGNTHYIIDESSRIRLREAYGREVILKDKGRAAATILLDEGSSLWGEPVVPALHWIAEEVTRTIKVFEIVFGIRQEAQGV